MKSFIKKTKVRQLKKKLPKNTSTVQSDESKPEHLKGKKKSSKPSKPTYANKKPSSAMWLKRQSADKYVQLAKKEGFKSRAVYKLIEINEKYKIIHPGATIADLGAAPGGWSQAVDHIYSKNFVNHSRSKIACDIVALDLLEFDINLANIELHKIIGDFNDIEVQEKIEQQLAEIFNKSKKNITNFKKNDQIKFDLVLSDMAPNTCGHILTDHQRITMLAEEVLNFSIRNLAAGGSLVCKVFAGGTEIKLLNSFKANFSKVYHFKPNSSRPESKEWYLIALGFKNQA